MNKGFVYIILIVLVGILGYITLIKKSAITTQSPSNSAVSKNSSTTQPETAVSQSLPATCIDQFEAKAVITSLSSYSGPVGTQLEIRGCNFAGFEGDKNAMIENAQGTKGVLFGESGSTAKLVKVILKSPLCEQNNSYSGLPCSAYLNLIPGTYKIYITPWDTNTKSNVATFTIQ